MAANLTEERMRLAESCLDDGWSFRQITLTHGISGPTLRRHFPGRGMDQREAGRLGYAAMKTMARQANKSLSTQST